MLFDIVILEYYKEYCIEIAYNNVVLYAKPPFLSQMHQHGDELQTTVTI